MSKRVAIVSVAAALCAACGPGARPTAATPPAPGPAPDAAPPPAVQPDAAPPASQPAAEVPPPPPPPPAPRRYRVTVLSATIDGKTAGGHDWDEGVDSPIPPPSGPMVSYLHAHPELDDTRDTLGEPVLAPGLSMLARQGGAPDPMVFLEVGGAVFRSPMTPRSFQPLWQFAFELTAAPGPDDTARVTVVDWDGPVQYDVIGSTVVPLADLLSRRVVELPRFGNVAQLTLEVVPAEAAAVQRRLAVPGTRAWTDTGVDVLAGQRVEIEASGQVCKDRRERCDFPDGEAKPAGSNLPGFDRTGHGALVGALGDTRFFVGRHRSFVAPSSGRLYLGVNDRIVKDNTGSFDVRVTVR